jgi:hypothetical protein
VSPNSTGTGTENGTENAGNEEDKATPTGPEATNSTDENAAEAEKVKFGIKSKIKIID